MCGIAGIISFDGTAPEADDLERMMCAMRLRGPDARGLHVSRNVGFAHTRLSIIDLECGAQPMSNEDGTVWVTFNGEIFNFRRMRGELEKRGHRFRTRSDTEIIVHLYEEYGEDVCRHLDGFFAFALYDSGKNLLIAGRDRLGVKPFYYFKDSAHFAFASSIGALMRLPWIPAGFDEQALWDYLSLQYVPVGTVYSRIHELTPGHVLSFRTEGSRRNFSDAAYWCLDFTRKTDLSYPDACAELKRRMERSVADRLVADVPLGVFLSGGLDSTVIAGLAAEQSGAPLQCFSIGFEDPSYDERNFAAENAAHLRKFAKHGLEHHVKVVNPCDFESLELLAGEFGEPYADASMIPTYLLSRFARERVTVALSGDGADELFGGYERYLAMRYLSRFDSIPETLRRPLFRALSGMIPPLGNERQKCARTKRFLTGASRSGAERYLGILSRVDEERKRRVCGDLFTHVCPTGEVFLREFYEKTSAQDPAERASEMDIASYLRGDILPKVDVCSMSASLEVRSPFLDYKIAEFSAALPYSFKETNGMRKRILADAFAKYLPVGLASRRKRGFGVPLAAWFRGEWRELLKERLLDGRGVRLGIFWRAELERLLAEHVQKKADHSYFLFSALILELFLKRS